MKQKVYKIFYNYEKEEKWLNQMAAKGLNLVDYSFIRYLFEEGEPGGYIYRLELLNNLPSHPESRAYIKFMEDSGIECVSTYLRWVYFRKKASEGPFEIYSDYFSKIIHYRRVRWFFGVVGFINLFVGLINLFLGIFNHLYSHVDLNLAVSLLNLSLSLFVLLPLCITYTRKIRLLKKESRIHES